MNLPWTKLFYCGFRSESEIELFAYSHTHPQFPIEHEIAVIHRSYGFGFPNPISPQSLDPKSYNYSLAHDISHIYHPANQSRSALYSSVLLNPCSPDSILVYATNISLPRSIALEDRLATLNRIANLISTRFPARHDLLFQLIASESAYSILKSLPDDLLPPSAFYSNTTPCIYYFHSLWAKGHYERLFREYATYYFHKRWFPNSDFILRGYTILGFTDRVISLFRQIWRTYSSKIGLLTISNMLFAELGTDFLDDQHVAKLVAKYQQLSLAEKLPINIHTKKSVNLLPKPLSINERPLLAVVSPDLRNHPVGRFWLPISNVLTSNFRIIHIALNSNSSSQDDPIKSRLQTLSHDWYGVLGTEKPYEVLSNINPDILIDLGGHTADSCPSVLNHRFAPLQVTYLGFYGPSYGSECDWWILDDKIAPRIQHSYTGSEPIWSLPCPSLCFDPEIHGLPDIDDIIYSDSSTPIFGSFNHTRKLTEPCLQRFASVINSIPKSSLLFRSHSFYDKQVRRWFLQRLVNQGIPPEHLLAIPYATTPLDAYNDYGKINVHLDSYPVCGTTTTLDSLAMGIPVLTCPNKLYAGAISASLLEHFERSSWIATSEQDLSNKAANLSQTFSCRLSRRNLALSFRKSVLCDTQFIPQTFSDQLSEMYRAKNS